MDAATTHSMVASSDRALTQTMSFHRRPQFAMNLENASETSSVCERRIAGLLGGSSDSDREDEHHAHSPSNNNNTRRNIGHRLYHTGCTREKQKQEHLREERERLLMQEMAQMTQRPNITTRARGKSSKGNHFAEHAALWSAQRDHKLRSKAEEVAQERFGEVTGEPEINPHSDMLVKTSDYKDPVSGWREHFASYKTRKTERAPEYSFTPSINPNAMRPDADQEIADRLYRESTERKHRRVQLAREQQARAMIDPGTGRPFFTPHALRETQRRDPAEVTAQLHEESFEINRRREAAAAAGARGCGGGGEEDSTGPRFQPKINPISEAMAASRRKPLYQSREERQAAMERTRERVEKSRAGASSNASDTPRGGGYRRAASNTPVNAAKTMEEFLRREQRDRASRTQRLNAIREEQAHRDTQECTFHPAISRVSEELFYASNGSHPLQHHYPYGDGMSTPRGYGTSMHTPRGTSHGASAAATPPSTATSRTPRTPRGTGSDMRHPVPAHPVAGSTGSPRGTSATSGAEADFAALMVASGLRSVSEQAALPPSHPSAPSQPLQSPPPVVRKTVEHVQQYSQHPGMMASPDVGARSVSAHARNSSVKQASDAGFPSPSPSGEGELGQYLAAFEVQMSTALEEWRRLEEV